MASQTGSLPATFLGNLGLGQSPPAPTERNGLADHPLTADDPKHQPAVLRAAESFHRHDEAPEADLENISHSAG